MFHHNSSSYVHPWRFSDDTWRPIHQLPHLFTAQEARDIIQNLDRTRHSIFPNNDKDYFHYEFEANSWRVHFYNRNKLLIRPTTWLDVSQRSFSNTEQDKLNLVKKLVQALQGYPVITEITPKTWSFHDPSSLEQTLTADNAQEILQNLLQDGTRISLPKDSNYFYFDPSDLAWYRANHNLILDKQATVINTKFINRTQIDVETLKTLLPTHDLPKVDFVERLIQLLDD